MTDSKQLVTPKFRVAFPHLFEKETFDEGEPKFSVTMLFPKDTDLAPLKNAVKAAIDEKWGDKRPKGLKLPFKDGDAVDEEGELLYPYSGYEGHISVKASSRYDVGIVDLKKVPIIDPEEVYGGCYGRAFVQAAAFDLKTSKGVTLYLVHFQKLADGEKFQNRIAVQDAFDDDVSEQSDADKAFADDPLDFGV